MQLYRDDGKTVDFRVPVDIMRAARVWGRRRATPIQAVHVADVGDEVWIEGVGAQGEPIEASGFRLQPNELDDLCEAWLAARGKCVTTPDVIEQSLLYRLV
jgi:hypothetical protein